MRIEDLKLSKSYKIVTIPPNEFRPFMKIVIVDASTRDILFVGAIDIFPEIQLEQLKSRATAVESF